MPELAMIEIDGYQPSEVDDKSLERASVLTESWKAGIRLRILMKSKQTVQRPACLYLLP